jgi:hypothetical protein
MLSMQFFVNEWPTDGVADETRHERKALAVRQLGGGKHEAGGACIRNEDLPPVPLGSGL